MSKDIFPQSTPDLATRELASRAVSSIGDPDTHRQYSSLFKRLRGRRLQVQFDNAGLPQAE